MNEDNKTSNEILKEALHYLELGFSVIPIKQDKKPLLTSWEEYQHRRASTEEVEAWFKEFPEANIAIVTGTISNLVVVDVEAGGSIEGYPPTVISKTGGGGWHLFYRHPGEIVHNSIKKIGPFVDTKADGGYVVAPPSLHLSGNRYEWVMSPEDADFADFPTNILEQTRTEKTKKDWTSVFRGVADGKRNDTTTSVAGKFLAHFPVRDWESVAWPALQGWNSKNIPPLDDTELRSVFDSIASRESAKREEKESINDEKKTQVEFIIKIFEDTKVELFYDEIEECYARVQMSGHMETRKCRGKELKLWVAHALWASKKKALNPTSWSAALSVIEGRARFDGQCKQLSNRTALGLDGEIWYDLADEKWRAIKVIPGMWELIDSPPPLFRRYAHQKAQDDPITGGDPKQFLEFTNVADEQNRLLLMVYLVSCFVPSIPHPIPILYGEQGASKTTLFRFLRNIVDPSVLQVLTFPTTITELVQKLSHNWIAYFDNVTSMPEWISDALCRAVSGEGFAKRELYSDDEDVIYAFQRCVGINGINLAANKPDLLDRSILIGLKRITPDKRIQEKDLWKKFKEAKPGILGGIFDTLSRAMAILPTIQTTMLPRMADFALWGCAIAKALGHTQEEFLDAYFKNIGMQNEEAVHESVVATAMLAFMEERSGWEGSSSSLLKELNGIAETEGINVNDRLWPKSANVFSRRLNEVKTNLAEIGIQLEYARKSSRRLWIIHNDLSKNTVITDISSQTTTEIPDANDGSDGISGGLDIDTEANDKSVLAAPHSANEGIIPDGTTSSEDPYPIPDF